MRRLLVAAAAVILLLAGGVAAWALWTAGSNPGGNGAAAATSVSPGLTPTASVAGQSVTVNWSASTLTSGQPVTGYLVKRYDSGGTLAEQTILSACDGTITATTCIENNVPAGSWVYSVTPRFATNWLGAESPKSTAVTVDVTAPVNAISMSVVTGNAAKSGNTIFYNGSLAGSFTLTNAVSDAGSGPASSATASLGGTSTGWTHSPSTVSTPAGGPYVSTLFSWAASTTSSPTEVVTGRDVAGNTAATTLTFVNDSTAPTVSNVSSPSNDGSYKVGQVIPVTVTFTEAVTVTGFPQLTLSTGTPATTAVNYTSGSGTNVLTFDYTVAAGNTSADLAYASTTALGLNTGTIRDAAANNATLTLANPGTAGSLSFNKALVIDTTLPTVSGVSSTSTNGTYTLGAVIPVTVTFSEPVTVTGTPQLTLSTGSPATTAVNYSSGSGTSVLTFNYTVAAGNNSPDLAYAPGGALALNSGTIRDAAANNATLTLAPPATAGSLSFNKNLVIDTVPTVLGVSSTLADGSYKAGQVIPVTVTFTEPVTVTGFPRLTLSTGTPAMTPVNYSSGSGTTVLTFNYTVAAGNTSGDLAYASTTALALNGGTIRDAAANNATLTLANPGTVGSLSFNKALVIDTTLPTVSGVSSTSTDGIYTLGAVIPVTVTFSEPVTVTGTPQLTLSTGSPATTAVNYSSGSGTSVLTFNYTVAAGNNSPDLRYDSTTALGLNTGTIRDAAANNATLTLATPGNTGSLSFNKNLVIDTVPTVMGVSSTLADGSYKAGQVIPVTVTFTEPVTVTGIPQLTLSTGTPATTAVNYTSGSGTNVLTFNYTVAAANTSTDLAYASTTALGLNTGTIRDAAANNATLTLVTPGTAGSLSSNKNLVIDTTAPTVTINQAAGQADPASASPINFNVVFSETTTTFATGDVTFTGTSTGTKVGTVTGSGTTYNVAVTGMTSSGTVIAAIAAGAATDLAGNNNTAATFADNTVTYTMPCTPGSATVTATADAWIDQSSPAQNKGGDSNLFVTSKSGSANVRSLVKFALPTVPAGCSVTAASFSLYNQSPVTGRVIDVYQAAAAWVEGTVNWTNQPATTGTAVGNTTTATAGLQQWNVLTQVQGQYAGTNNGFILRDRTEDAAAGPQQNYRAREGGTTPPALVISWS